MDVKNSSSQALSAITHILLQQATIVQFTRHQWKNISLFCWKRCGHDSDPAFQRVRQQLEQYTIKNVSRPLQYGHVLKGKEPYWYKLSPALKFKFKHSGLLWDIYISSPKNQWYGFENPYFYQKTHLIGGVISHEPMIFLHLNQAEKTKLEKKGVVFH